MGELAHTVNPFNGVVIDSARLTDDPAEFETSLALSLHTWKQQGYKVVWLELPLAKSALVPVAARAGFEYHHADKDYVEMTLALEEGAHVPNYASHYIGAGGVVLNDNKELLVVSELHRRNRRGPAYKLPGGALYPGEHVVEGVVREVLEETGVHAAFDALVCFRHWHGYRYRKSDIYFVCRLTALSSEITRQVDEIEDCLWMPVEQYLSQDDTSPFNKSIVRAAVTSPGIKPSQMDGYDDPSKYEFFMPRETV
jgi:8-oxo-dGTP pyrophosphatase MutT (NUDIX family)